MLHRYVPPALRRPAPDAAPTLSLGWWRVFALELPIVAATCAYWLFDPRGFLGSLYGLDPAPPGAVGLLYSYAASVGSMVLWLYARLLFAPTIDRLAFRRYQEALLVGDVGVVAATLALGQLQPLSGDGFAALGMATLWGSIRGFWLLQGRRG